MGAALASSVLGVERPRVGLLSNGTEDAKGRDEVVEANERLRAMDGFVGNVEGFALTEGVADVIVTDGFTGNVALKVAEGVSKAMIDFVRRAATSTPRAKAGGLLLKPVAARPEDRARPRGGRRRVPARPPAAARRAARLVRRPTAGPRRCAGRGAASRRTSSAARTGPSTRRGRSARPGVRSRD